MTDRELLHYVLGILRGRNLLPQLCQIIEKHLDQQED